MQKIEELETLQTQKMVQGSVNISTLLVYSKGLMQLSDRLDDFDNFIINILGKDPDETFQKRMKGRI